MLAAEIANSLSSAVSAATDKLTATVGRVSECQGRAKTGKEDDVCTHILSLIRIHAGAEKDAQRNQCIK